VQMRISYLEIYNDKGYDLLDPAHEHTSLEQLPRVTLLEGDRGELRFKNLGELPAATIDEALNLLFVGDTNRVVACVEENTLLALPSGGRIRAKDVTTDTMLLGEHGEAVQVLYAPEVFVSEQAYRVEYEVCGKASSHTLTPEHRVTLRWGAHPSVTVVDLREDSEEGDARQRYSTLRVRWHDRDTLLEQSHTFRFVEARDALHAPASSATSTGQGDPDALSLPSCMTHENALEFGWAWLFHARARGLARPLERGELLEVRADELCKRWIAEPALRELVALPLVPLPELSWSPAVPAQQEDAAVTDAMSRSIVASWDDQTAAPIALGPAAVAEMKREGLSDLLVELSEEDSVVFKPYSPVERPSSEIPLPQRLIDVVYMLDAGSCSMGPQDEMVPSVKRQLESAWRMLWPREECALQSEQMQTMRNALQHVLISFAPCATLADDGATTSTAATAEEEVEAALAAMDAALAQKSPSLLVFGSPLQKQWLSLWPLLQSRGAISHGEVRFTSEGQAVLTMDLPCGHRTRVHLCAAHPSAGWAMASVMDAMADAHGVKLYEATRAQIAEIERSSFVPLVSLTRLPSGSGLKFKGIHVSGSQRFVLGDSVLTHNSTPSNDQSTRSHCIFIISLESRSRGGDGKVRRSKLNLVDLAGSERIKKTGVGGKIMNEALAINVSLHHLEQVIVALHDAARHGGQGHIPYRNSMLTSVLRDSLGGNCRTVMISTLSPERGHLDESISTSRFAQRVAQIKNRAMLNEEVDPYVLVKQLKSQLREARDELAVARGAVGAKYRELDEEELASCTELVRAFLRDDRDKRYFDEDGSGSFKCIAIPNPYKLRACFDAFKEAWKGNCNNPALNVVPAEGSTVSAPNAVADNKAAAAEIARLQRENAALVDALRRAAGADTADAVLSDVRRGGSGSRTAATTAAAERPRERERERDREQQSRSRDAGKPSTSAAPLPAAAPTPAAAAPAAPAPSPEDLALARARAESFEVFRRSYRKQMLIEEQKATHAAKVDLARKTGESINKLRNEINEAKAKVEAHRLARGVAALTDGDGAAGALPPDATELSLLARIDKAKEAYRSDFALLKGLKAEIDFLKAVVEKSRAKLQADFERWWSTQPQGMQEAQNKERLMASAAMVAASAGETDGQQEEPPTSSRARPSSARHSSNSAANSAAAPRFMADAAAVAGGASASTPSSASSSSSSRSGSRAYPPAQPQEAWGPPPSSSSSSSSGRSGGASSSSSSSSAAMPGGLHSTGNSAADADIAHFYRLKEEMMRMRQQQQQQ